MRWPEQINSRVVDQNIHVAISELDRSLRYLACAVCVSKIRQNKIRFASRGPDFVDCLLTALRIAPYNQYVDAELRQLMAVARPMPLVPPVINAVEVFGVMCPFLDGSLRSGAFF